MRETNRKYVSALTIQLSSLFVKGRSELEQAAVSLEKQTVDVLWTVKRNLLEFDSKKFCVCSQKDLS